jgi:hypothetical protein
MLWFEQWLEWWRWFIPSSHVAFESPMERILEVDTPEQHVPPHVWYGTTCLLIRNAIGCVSYSIEWGLTSLFLSYIVIYFVTYFVKTPEPYGARGAFAGNP